MRQTWAVDRAGDGHSDRQRRSLTASQSHATGCRQRRLSVKLMQRRTLQVNILQITRSTNSSVLMH